jgi:hypothetical protein
MPTCNSSNHLLYPQSKFVRNQTNITTQSNKKIRKNIVQGRQFLDSIPEMERYRPGEESDSVVKKEELAVGDGRGGGVFAGAGETGESWASGMAVRWGTTKVNKASC